MISYYRFILIMALFCTIFHISTGIGRKSRNLYTAPVLKALVRGDPIGISQRQLALLDDWTSDILTKV